MEFQFPGESFVCFDDHRNDPVNPDDNKPIPEPKNLDSNAKIGNWCSASTECTNEDDDSDVK